MGVKGKKPHNALILYTFSQLEHAVGLLTAVLPPAIVKHLDLSTLELAREHLVDEKLLEVETDSTASPRSRARRPSSMCCWSTRAPSTDG